MVAKSYWVDTSYSEGMEVESVAFASDRYFELSANPDTAEILALSPEILFVVDATHAIRVTVEDESAYLPGDTHITDSESTAEHDGQDKSFWTQVWDWLSGGPTR